MRLVAGTALVFIAPLVEVFVLHRAVHATIGANAAVLGIYARDVYVPLFVGALAGLHFLRSKHGLRLTIVKPMLLLNGVAFLATYAAISLLADWGPGRVGPEAGVAIVFFAGVTTLLSSLFLWLSPLDLASALKPYRHRLPFAAFALTALVTYPIVLQTLWRPISHYTAKLVFYALYVLGQEPIFYRGGLEMVLRVPTFMGVITMGCAGIEGIFYFLFSYSLYRLFGRRSPGPARSLAIYAAGCTFMFFLNVLRITAFFLVAIYVEANVGSRQSRELFEWAFHANVGWILYLGGIVLFLHVAKRADPSYVDGDDDDDGGAEAFLRLRPTQRIRA